jgi:drug/metabolite transporter (DMT)-like permease
VSIAAVLLLAIAAAGRQRWPSAADTRRLLLRGVLGNCLYQIFFIEGVSRATAGTAALILAASPAFIALVGRVSGTERSSPRAAFAIVLSIAGVGLVILGATSAGDGSAAARDQATLGSLLLLGGCFCWALFTVLLQPLTHRVPGIQLTGISLLGGAVPHLFVSLPSLGRTNWAAVDALGWGALAYSSMLALVVAYVIYYRGVRILGPTRTAMYGNLQPVIALIFAWLTLGELPTWLQLAGAATIMAGILITRQKQRTATAAASGAVAVDA